MCESTLPATLPIQPFIHNQHAHSTHSCHHKVYRGPFTHLQLFGSHMRSTLFTLHTLSSATQHRKRQGWLVWEGGAGVQGREVTASLPTPRVHWPPPSPAPCSSAPAAVATHRPGEPHPPWQCQIQALRWCPTGSFPMNWTVCQEHSEGTRNIIKHRLLVKPKAMTPAGHSEFS